MIRELLLLERYDEGAEDSSDHACDLHTCGHLPVDRHVEKKRHEHFKAINCLNRTPFPCLEGLCH